MTPILSHETRCTLSRYWSQHAPPYLNQDTDEEVDAIWFPPSHRAGDPPKAFLHCLAIHADTQRIAAHAMKGQTSAPRRIDVPMDEVVFLTHSSLPPLSLAHVISKEPLLATAGDAAAYRLRCLAGIGLHQTVLPSALVAAIPGVHLRAPLNKDAASWTCAFRWTDKGVALFVNPNPRTGQVDEERIGLALAAWFCSRTPFGSFEPADPEGPPDEAAEKLRRQIVETYQALRLPALHLYLALRALGNEPQEPGPALMEAFQVPTRLLFDRLDAILASMRWLGS